MPVRLGSVTVTSGSPAPRAARDPSRTTDAIISEELHGTKWSSGTTDAFSSQNAASTRAADRRARNGHFDGGMPRTMNWKTFLAGLLVLTVAFVHVRWPHLVSLDWPTIVLLIAGLLFFFARPLAVFLPYIKKLKLGAAEIELQDKLSDLRANVEQLQERIPREESPSLRLSADPTQWTRPWNPRSWILLRRTSRPLCCG